MKVARQHKAEAGKRRKVSAKGLQGGGYSGLQRVMAGYGYGYGYVLVWFGLVYSARTSSRALSLTLAWFRSPFAFAYCFDF